MIQTIELRSFFESYAVTSASKERERWRRVVSNDGIRRRPLKIGIHKDILAAVGGALTRAMKRERLS
jgi:hypothetical protein